MPAILLKYQFPDDYIDEIYDSAFKPTYFEVFLAILQHYA